MPLVSFLKWRRFCPIVKHSMIYLAENRFFSQLHSCFAQYVAGLIASLVHMKYFLIITEPQIRWGFGIVLRYIFYFSMKRHNMTLIRAVPTGWYKWGATNMSLCWNLENYPKIYLIWRTDFIPAVFTNASFHLTGVLNSWTSLMKCQEKIIRCQKTLKNQKKKKREVNPAKLDSSLCTTFLCFGAGYHSRLE